MRVVSACLVSLLFYPKMEAVRSFEMSVKFYHNTVQVASVVGYAKYLYFHPVTFQSVVKHTRTSRVQQPSK
jgi:hypothetical protein